MKERLGDYIQEYSVRNRNGEDIPVYSVTNTQGFCKDYFGKEVASKDKTTYKIVPKGCFAYNPSRINVGSVDCQRYEDRVIVSPLYNVFSVSDNLDKQYLYYYLKSDIALQRIKTVASGSVRDNLKLSMLYEFPINIRSIEEQKDIVNKLDHIKNIIDLRKRELHQLDELVKARFVELFGDPVCNSKNLVLSPLNDVCTKITDGTHDTPPRYDSGYLLITGKNIRSSGIIFDDVEFVSGEDHKIIYGRCNPEYGDVLYTNIGVNYGTACYNNLDYEFSMKNVALLKPNQRLVNGYYLWECLNIMRNHILSMNQVGGAQTFMGLATIKKITIPVPQIELQNQFAAFVEQTDKSKVVVQKALDEAQTLFDSLMQEYFG